AAGLEVTADDLRAVVGRTYLRGYAAERRFGFTPDDYTLPAAAHEEMPEVRLPYFITEEFFAALRERVLATFDARVAAADWL
nr:aldehyde ferredoxin oxidoreductase C-terminal domain-containing protein [Acidimicrobiia bacterium]